MGSRRRFAFHSVFAGALAASLTAQHVVMSNGEVLPGTVVSVEASNAKIRCTDGSLRQVSVRSIDHERSEIGSKRFAAQHVAGPMTEPAKAVVAQLAQGREVSLPELMVATERCTDELVTALRELASSKKPGVRQGAVRALVAAATGPAMKAALEAAHDDAALRKEVVTAVGGGAWLAAIEACDGLAEIELGLTAIDRATRRASAWIAAKLGSDAALPVLAQFVADSDHHVRETVAACLAERGNAAGAAVLLTIAKREKAPVQAANRDADAATQQMLERVVLRERVHACELLGALRHVAAVPVLRALGKHADAELAAAARAALEQIESGVAKGR